MRLVRFEDESGGFAVDLHPLITVISGLPAHVRERLVQGLASLPRGTDPGGRGSIEVHGVYLDLNRESLELLELHQDLDVILRATDLPGSEHADADAGDDEVFETLVSGADSDEIREAKQAVADQEEAYDAAVRALETCREQLAEIESEQASLNARLSKARSGLDSFAAAGLKVAREELAKLVAASAPGAGVADTADRERIESRLSVLIEESDRLKRLIKSLKAIDPAPVRAAYDAIVPAARQRTAAPASVPASVPARTPAPVRTAVSSLPSPEAEALIDEWNEIDARLAELDAEASSGRSLLDELEAQRDEAYEDLKAAERNLRSPELDQSRVDRLESVHDEIFELDGRTPRFGAGKVRRRLETLRKEERELLLELGFDSWSSYIMGITSAGSDPVRRRAVDSARAAYELAEAELARAAAHPPVPTVDPELERWEDAREDVWTRIVELLGHDPGDDPVAALEAFRIEVEVDSEFESEVDSEFDSEFDGAFDSGLGFAAEHDDVSGVDEGDSDIGEAAADRLREALEATGAEMPRGELSVVELRSLAKGWLETMELLPQRIADVTAERNEIEDEISELATEYEALQQIGEAPPAAAIEEESPELAAARDRVAEGERRMKAHESAVALVATIELENERLDDRARELHLMIAEREPRAATLLEQRVVARNRLRRAEASRSATESARWENRHMSGGESSRYVDGSAGAEAVEWYVLARLAQQRSVSFVGSVPLVIDDAFVNWPIEALGDVFTRLERMGEVIQIVYLTDDPEVGSWARSLGADRALVLDMRVAS